MWLVVVECGWWWWLDVAGGGGGGDCSSTLLLSTLPSPSQIHPPHPKSIPLLIHSIHKTPTHQLLDSLPTTSSHETTNNNNYGTTTSNNNYNNNTTNNNTTNNNTNNNNYDNNTNNDIVMSLANKSTKDLYHAMASSPEVFLLII